MTEAEITYINSPEEHDAVVAEADRGRPTVICLLNDATPVCKAVEPKFHGLAARYADSGVRFCIMYYNNTTSMMSVGFLNRAIVPADVLQVQVRAKSATGHSLHGRRTMVSNGDGARRWTDGSHVGTVARAGEALRVGWID